MGWKALALLGFVTIGNAPSEHRFDLVCTGTRQYFDPALGNTKSAYQTEFHFDLSAKLYCADACTQVFPIPVVDDRRITFTEPHKDERTSGGSIIDRITGKLTIYSFDRTGGLTIDADCKPTAFGGFPDQTKKF